MSQKRRSNFENVGPGQERVVPEEIEESVSSAPADPEPEPAPAPTPVSAPIEAGIEPSAFADDFSTYHHRSTLANQIIGSLDDLQKLRETLTQLRFAVQGAGSNPSTQTFYSIAQRVVFVEQEYQRVLSNLFALKNELLLSVARA